MAHVTTRISLVELIVVLTIVGLMASVAVPTYHLHAVRDQINEAQARVAKLKDVIADMHKRTGRFPVNNQAAGSSLTGHPLGKYVERVDIEHGAVHITMANKADEQITGKVLTLRPLVAEDADTPIAWSCGYSALPRGTSAVGVDRTNVDARFLPFVCRMAYR